MLTGVTPSGFKFSIEEEARDDIELLENLSALQEGDMTAMPKIIKALLGEEQTKKLYDHCRGKKGRTPVTKVAKELQDIFAAAKSDIKN